VGTCSEFAKHLKHDTKDPSYHVWLHKHKISLKVTASRVAPVWISFKIQKRAPVTVTVN
jgi:hypothetical protein